LIDLRTFFHVIHNTGEDTSQGHTEGKTSRTIKTNKEGCYVPLLP